MASELECLVVVEAVKYFAVYLTGVKFKLWTNHKALEALFHRKFNRRLAGCALFLQEFDFVIRYRPGSQNSNADGMSRQVWQMTTQMSLAEPLNQVVESRGEGDVVDSPHKDFTTWNSSQHDCSCSHM